MVCKTCSGNSITGRVITGRSRPGTDVRYKNGTDPYYGKPMSYDDRQKYYWGANYVNNKNNQAQKLPSMSFDTGAFIVGGIIGFILAGLVLTNTGRTITYRSGQKVARRLK